MRNVNEILVGEPDGNGPLGNRNVDGTTQLEWILKKYVGAVWVGFIWLRIGTSGGLL
jgi:hypothetical protein